MSGGRVTGTHGAQDRRDTGTRGGRGGGREVAGQVVVEWGAMDADKARCGKDLLVHVS